jgi:hypothetical protein
VEEAFGRIHMNNCSSAKEESHRLDERKNEPDINGHLLDLVAE